MEIIDYLARWGHFLFGITWIGLLYYFNFIQGAYFKEAEDSARVDAFTKLVPRAMWYFRWAALMTFLTGIILLAYLGQATSVDITLGAVLGTLMFLNVWLIIWPNQRILIESNQKVKDGGEALPEAAAAAPKALLASRTNTMFSFPMLFLMGSSAHLPTSAGVGHGMLTQASALQLVVPLILIAILELNAIVGKQGPMASVKGVIICGLVLTAVLFGLLEVL